MKEANAGSNSACGHVGRWQIDRARAGGGDFEEEGFAVESVIMVSTYPDGEGSWVVTDFRP